MKSVEKFYKTVPCNCGDECHPPCPGTMRVRDIEKEKRHELKHCRARNAELEDQIQNPKMTYCAFCGERYDIEDREKAIELITAHVYACEKHPLAIYSKRIAELERERKEQIDIVLSNPMTCCNGVTHPPNTCIDNCLYCKLTELEAEVERLRKMIDHGIGPQDMKNDITYPDER